MKESPRRRRSPLVVILDAVLGFVAAVQAGHLPRMTGRTGRAGNVAWLAVGLLAAAGGTAILVVALVRAPDSLTALPPAAAAELPPASSAPPSPSAPPVAPPTSSATSSPPPTRGPATRPPAAQPPPTATPLVARYAATDGGTGLLSYRAVVTIANRGADSKDGWKLTVTLPRPTLRIAAVSGATAQQDGSTWTFTPVDATRRVLSGGSVEVAFEVRGATLVAATPTDCRIDGNPCQGLAD